MPSKSNQMMVVALVEATYEAIVVVGLKKEEKDFTL